MKKLLYLAICAAALSLGCGSCDSSAEKHAESVALPDSALVGTSLPVIDGSLSEYFNVKPLPYVLSLTDSLPELGVTLEFTKKYQGIANVEMVIENADSLLSKFPYIVLVDSAANAVEGFVLEIDTAQLAQVRALMSTEPTAEIQVRFKAKEAYPVEKKDSVAAVARNFKVVANTKLNVDKAAVDAAIAKFRKETAYYNETASVPLPPTSMAAGLANSCEVVYRRALAAAQVYYPVMTPEQKAEFERIKKSKRSFRFGF